jgi:D-3-phosphoglycerate dehydrogenase
MKPLVLLSERIGPLTDWESSIPEQVPSVVECRSLATRGEIAENAAEAEVIILGTVELFDAKTLAGLPKLRLIARRGVGFDNVDVAAAAGLGITVTNVPDASIEEVSDSALALTLALLRGVVPAHQAVKRQRPDLARQAVDATVPLSECTLAILGYGRIGRRLADKARGVFGRLLVVDPYVEEAAGARVVPLAEALAISDALSIHVPLNDHTLNLIDKVALEAARPGLVVVNTSRAGVIDEQNLAAAVRAGSLSGVGLDVTADEKLWLELIDEGFENVLLTGHTGARGRRAQVRLRSTCAEQVVDFLSGRRPAHVLADLPEEWSRREA